MRSFLCRALGAQPHELPALGWAFAYFFLLLSSYYILRPVRDEMAVQAGTAQLQWLFTATFLTMLALVPVFGWLCARLPRAKMLPAVYFFFALNLAAFWAASRMGVPARDIAPVFFVWMSVFNLFVVSVSGASWPTCSTTRKPRACTAQSPRAEAAARSPVRRSP